MPHFVTSAQEEDHINSFNDAHYHASTYGPGVYVLSGGKQLAATMTDSNTIRILSGEGLVNGRFWEIEGDFEEYTIENGTPGFKRTDLVVCHIETAPQEKIDIRVLKGEETTGDPVMPVHIEGDLNDGDTVVEQPLWAVTLDGINPEEPMAQFEVTPSFMEFRDSLSQSHVLWSGTWSSGSITVPGLSGYKLLAVESDGGTVMCATVSRSKVDCSLVASTGSGVLLSAIRISRNGDTLTWESSFGRILGAGGFGNTDYKFTVVTAIHGLL